MAYIKSLFYRERAAELYYEVDERQNCHQSRDNYRDYVGNRLLAIFAFAGDNSDGSFLTLRYADADKSREPYCLRHGLVDEEDDGDALKIPFVRLNGRRSVGMSCTTSDVETPM